jgi:hypothetical protein
MCFTENLIKYLEIVYCITEMCAMFTGIFGTACIVMKMQENCAHVKKMA